MSDRVSDRHIRERLSYRPLTRPVSLRFGFNTASITDLALVDAWGADVSEEFGLRVESGAQYSVVPEPSTFLLLGLGLVVVAMIRRTGKRNSIAM